MVASLSFDHSVSARAQRREKQDRAPLLSAIRFRWLFDWKVGRLCFDDEIAPP
jgi:hypothetical protein